MWELLSTKIDKMLENSTCQRESQNIYVSMTRMYSNAETPRRDLGDSLQLTNCILGSGANCNMTQDISYFIPGSLAETDKYIKVTGMNFVTEKQTGEV